MADCGTYAGYQAHRADGTPRCRPCKDAAAAYNRQRRLMGPFTGPGPWHAVLVDYLETFGPCTFVELVGLIQHRHPEARQETLYRELYRLEKKGIVEIHNDPDTLTLYGLAADYEAHV